MRILSGGGKTLDLPLAITEYQGIPLEFIDIWGTLNNQWIRKEFIGIPGTLDIIEFPRNSLIIRGTRQDPPCPP